MKTFERSINFKALQIAEENKKFEPQIITLINRHRNRYTFNISIVHFPNRKEIPFGYYVVEWSYPKFPSISEAVQVTRDMEKFGIPPEELLGDWTSSLRRTEWFVILFLHPSMELRKEVPFPFFRATVYFTPEISIDIQQKYNPLTETVEVISLSRSKYGIFKTPLITIYKEREEILENDLRELSNSESIRTKSKVDLKKSLETLRSVFLTGKTPSFFEPYEID